MQPWTCFTRMAFNIIKVSNFIFSSYKCVKAESCDHRTKLSPISLWNESTRWCPHSLLVCTFPSFSSGPCPHYVLSLLSYLFICMVQKSAFPKMIPHGQFLSSFQNCLCGLTSCQSEKESIFVEMFSSWRLESLPLVSVCQTLPTGFVRSHSVVVVSIYNGIEEILQPKLLAKKLLLWEREPKSWYFLVLCGEETTICGGIWLKW